MSKSQVPRGVIKDKSVIKPLTEKEFQKTLAPMKFKKSKRIKMNKKKKGKKKKKKKR